MKDAKSGITEATFSNPGYHAKLVKACRESYPHIAENESLQELAFVLGDGENLFNTLVQTPLQKTYTSLPQQDDEDVAKLVGKRFLMSVERILGSTLKTSREHRPTKCTRQVKTFSFGATQRMLDPYCPCPRCTTT